MFDVAIVGGGPGGGSCASFCAAAGLRVLLLERERFPRDKVCGDCLNPSCWPVLRRLGVAERIRSLPHGRLDRVDFITVGGSRVSVPLPRDGDPEIAVRRSILDFELMQRARELGAEVQEKMTLTGAVRQGDAWSITTSGKAFAARILVAADGRNSGVARFCNLLPRIEKSRIAIQTHLPLPSGFGERVVLEFRPEGYSGQAPIGDGLLNVCLVSTATRLPAIKRWAEARFDLPPSHSWRTITPLERAPILATTPNLFLIGDAARVIEPLTGEGIYYALASGELAANATASIIRGEKDWMTAAAEYQRSHALLYHGRLWVNRIARAAVLHPQLASAALRISSAHPALLCFLTRRIVQA